MPIIHPFVKLLRLCVTIVGLLSASLSLDAATYSYPSDADPWFTYELPDTWHPKVEDEILEASSPDHAGSLGFWILPDRSDFKIRDKDLAEILKESVRDAKMFNSPTKKVIKGVEFHTFLGMGKDHEDKSPVSFEVWMFSPKPGKIGFLYFVRDTDNGAVMNALKKMVESIKLKN